MSGGRRGGDESSSSRLGEAAWALVSGEESQKKSTQRMREREELAREI